MITTEILIIGCGPAGMMAAIYAKRANREVHILEKSSPGGRVRSTYQVENYLGFGRVNAEELVNNMVTHLEALQIKDDFATCKRVSKEGAFFLVETDQETYQADVVIVASGTRPKPISCPGEQAFLSRGVSYCAVCDGIFYEHQNVLVVGGGDSALEESIYLANLCRHVTIVHDMPFFTASQGVIERIKQYPNISTMNHHKVVSFLGDRTLKQVILESIEDQSQMTLDVQGAFIYAGNQPESHFLSDLPVLDAAGFVMVSTEMASAIPGLFAAGDVTKKDYRLIATAISDGAIAALSAVKYLDLVKGRR